MHDLRAQPPTAQPLGGYLRSACPLPRVSALTVAKDARPLAAQAGPAPHGLARPADWPYKANREHRDSPRA